MPEWVAKIISPLILPGITVQQEILIMLLLKKQMLTTGCKNLKAMAVQPVASDFASTVCGIGC